MTKTINSFTSSPKHKSAKQLVRQGVIANSIIPSLKTSKRRIAAASVMKISPKPPPSPDGSVSNAYLKMGAGGRGGLLGSSTSLHRQTLNTSSAKPYKRMPHAHSSYISRLLSPADLNVPGFNTKEPIMEAMKSSYLFRNVKGDNRKRKWAWGSGGMLEHSAMHELHLLKTADLAKTMNLPGRRPPAR